MIRLALFAALILTILNSCEIRKSSDENFDEMTKQKVFGTLPDGTEIMAYELSNKHGVKMEVISLGGIITKLIVPDRAGKRADVVLGFDKLEPYINNAPYYGAIVGRYANRIANGKFELDGVEYQLPQNNGTNSIHGGDIGFDQKVWDVKPFTNEKGTGLLLSYTSEDGEMGFPGNLSCKVTYTLTNENAVQIDYEATTDKSTIVNFTHHDYFNLSGNGGDILNHELLLNASYFLPSDSIQIPTGERRAVKSTPFDFTSMKSIGLEIEADNQQIIYGRGYDHCWIIDGYDGEIKLAGTLYDPKSGRKMDVLTTEPGIQLYTGNYLDGSKVGKNNRAYDFREGLCLETQHFPDSPNHSDFPSTTLNPGDTFKSTTIFKFYTD